jgi:LmbE family N-acetylglucosaminyl deacetylase
MTAVKKQTPAPVVCLFCHPDDEFAIFAEIEALIAEGRRVVCVYLTDGAHGGQSPERRMAESRAVLGKLGVAAGDIHFPGHDLGIGDSTLFQRVAEAREAIRRLVASGGPRPRVLMPAWEGGHHDHDAAHLLGLTLTREPGLIAEAFQFSVYHGCGLPGWLFRVLSPLVGNGPVVQRNVPWRDRLRHLRFCLSYPSQWKTWIGLFPLVLTNYVIVGKQRLQRVDPTRVGQPPHAGVLLYERRGFCTWKEFAETTKHVRAAIGAGSPWPD